MNPLVNITVKHHGESEEKKYIRETEKELQEKIGKDYMIDYAGNLTWTIKPKLKNVYITGSIRL